MESKTYKDFKKGDTLVCVKSTTEMYTDNERLVVGEKYKVTDVDLHFPNKVCVKLKGPYYFGEEFVPIECFIDITSVRDLKLKQLGI